MNWGIVRGLLQAMGGGVILLLIVQGGRALLYGLRKKTSATEPVGTMNPYPESKETETLGVPDGEERMATEIERGDMNRLIVYAQANSADRKT